MEWRSVRGFEGYYEVSDTGIVRSLDRIVIGVDGVSKHLKGNEMKRTLSKNKRKENDGYYVVNLRKNSRANVIPIHVLVANAFIDNPSNLPTVNHIDGDKSNNNVANLEWSSYSENNQHALDMGLRSPRGVNVIQKDMNGNIIAEYRSVCEASRRTGIGRGVISHCVNNRINTAGGFLWEKLL